MKKSVAAWIALGLITVIAGLLLAITNEVTKGKIEAQAAEAKIEARKSVLPTAAEFELLELEDLQPLEDLYIGKSGETITGYVGTVVTKEGYGGPIEVIAGVDAQGKVTGVSVGGSEFSETAGLGAKAKEPAFMQQFIGKQTPVRAVKSVQDRADNTIDAITAATKTTNAVAGAVNAIAAKVDAYLNPETDVAAEGTTYTASVQGFAGPVAVLVTVKDNGAISALTVGDDQFAETDGYGARAKDPVFTKQFVGKSLPITIEDIDALSGATRTSVAVVDAINKAYEDKVVVAPPAPEGTRYTVSEQGFAGPVAVFVTAKDDGTITALSIGDDQFKETEGYGAGAREPAFIKQFIGKQLPLTLDAIDAISGATRTSIAVVNAINRAYEEKLVDAAGEQQPPVEGPAVMEEPAATEAPAATDAPVEDKPIADDRTATASVDGFIGPVAVTITLNADDTLAKVEVGDAQFNETEGLGSKARDEAFTAQFVGKKLPLTMEDIDAIAGATVTSKAVVEAINAAYATLAAPAEEAADSRTATASVDGFIGPVAVTITLNADDTLAKVEVGDAQFNETEGLGSKARDEAFTAQFVGKKLPLTMEDIDAIAGATVTSKAVVEAINAAYATLAAPAEEAADSRTATASVDGFIGPVAVTITLNADDTLAKVEVGDAQFNETEGLGSKAKDEEFTAQFVGKKLPLTIEDIDVIAGATVTSKAVVEAINAAYATLAAPAEEAADSRTATASVDGFIGPVAVTITLNADDTLAKVEVGDAQFNETEGLGSKARDEAFTAQFVGKKLPLTMEDIDVIAGATVTSKAVVEAINAAYKQLSK